MISSRQPHQRPLRSASVSSKSQKTTLTLRRSVNGPAPTESLGRRTRKFCLPEHDGGAPAAGLERAGLGVRAGGVSDRARALEVIELIFGDLDAVDHEYADKARLQLGNDARLAQHRAVLLGRDRNDALRVDERR